MSQDEEQTKRSRVVVETPTARREVVQQQTVRYPAEERRGYSTGMVATVALLAIAATAIIFLFLTNSREDSANTNVNIRTTAATQPTPMQAPVMVQQTPLTQPTPVIIQQVPAPVTTTQPAPIIIQAPPPSSTTTAPATPPASGASGTAPAAGNDDSSLQAKIDKAFADDPNVSAASVDAMVVNGRVKLTGTVNSEAVKQRAERLAYAVKGVLGVDNKIVVSGTP